ncbi:MAG: DUF4112 domain-containing protein [Chloroflexi bacterium]|nr:DUF4112 domain-containing protein [Chloroflexota bacterium]
MKRVTREPDRSRALSEVQTMAWLLDNSIPVPGTGGRRFGIDALIGLVPVVGDLVSGSIGLFVVWRGSRLRLPRIVVARMLANTALDVMVGAIPLAGDAFDLWFKSNTRNLNLMRRYLEQPDTSTRGEWMAFAVMAAIVLAVVLLLGWLLVSIVGEIVSLFG